MNNYNEIVKQILQEENKIDMEKIASLNWNDVLVFFALSIMDTYVDMALEWDDDDDIISEEEYDNLIQQYGEDKARGITNWRALALLQKDPSMLDSSIENFIDNLNSSNTKNDIIEILQKYLTQFISHFAKQLDLPDDVRNIDVQADTLF